MGKERKQRFREKYNPIGLPSMKEILQREKLMEMTCGPTDDRNVNSMVEDLLGKLQHPSEETKEAACLTLLCVLNQLEAADPILKRKEIIKSVLCLLHDPSDRVKSAAAGFLRNVSALNTEACQYLISNDILTPLTALFHQYGKDYTPKKEKDNFVGSEADTLLQIIHIYWNLCEASNNATSRSIKDNLLQLLVRYLDISLFGKLISMAAAQCLYCVCEDNIECCVVISEPSTKAILWHLLDLDGEDLGFLKTLSAGIIINIYGTINAQFDSDNESISKIIAVLLKSISDDTRGKIEGIARHITEIKCEKDETELKKKNANLDLELKKVDAIILNQRYAIEILTNMCGDDDKDSTCSSGEADEDTVVDMELDSTFASNGNGTHAGAISKELHNAIIQNNISSCILQKSIMPSEDVINVLSSHTSSSDLVKKMSSQSSQCLFCFHNIVSVLEIEELGGVGSMYETWLQLAEQTFTQKLRFGDSDLIEARSSVLRELISVLERSKDKMVRDQLLESNLELMLCAYKEIICNKEIENSCRINFVRVLGSIGTILMGKNGIHIGMAQPIIKEIGALLLSLTKDSDLLLLSEALDTLIDLFSEDYTDDVAKTINLCTHLVLAQATFTAKLKVAKRNKEWIFPVTHTIKDNLIPFVNYKKQRIK